MTALAVGAGLILVACLVLVDVGCRAIVDLFGALERDRRNEYRVTPRLSRPAPHWIGGAER